MCYSEKIQYELDETMTEMTSGAERPLVNNATIFNTRNGILYIDGVSSVELAKEYDTPLYVLSERKIREKYEILNSILAKCFERHRILYSAKANTSLSLLRLMKSLGANIDAVSAGEVFLSLEAGFQPEDILFTATMVPSNELEFILDNGVPINVDSISELRRLLALDTPEFLSFRVNPEFGAGHHEHVITAGAGSKFGISERDAVRAYVLAKDAGVRRFGIQMHIGSGILNVAPYITAVTRLLGIINTVHDKAGISFEVVDIGGGFGVPYHPSDVALDVNMLFRHISSLYDESLGTHAAREPIFAIEPGRFLVSEAGVLLTRVNTVEEKSGESFVGVDAGFNTLMRPAMYGSYHHVLVANRMGQDADNRYTIAGPLCESGDILAKDRPLPRIEEGDLIAIMNAGAYGFTMSSQYNSIPRAAEVLVLNEKHELIRTRETLETLKTGQRIASWLP
jgi:diaminopimelate decarboxylase